MTDSKADLGTLPQGSCKSVTVSKTGNVTEIKGHREANSKGT